MEVYGWGNHRTKWWVFHCHIWWPESIQGWFSTPITAGLMSVIPNCLGLIINKQTGWWFQPLWKIWKSVASILPNMMGKSFKIPWFQSPPTSKHFWGVPPCSHLGVPFASNPSKRGWSIARVLETWRIPYGRMIYKWWIFNIYLGQFTVGYLCLSMGIYDCTSGIIYILCIMPDIVLYLHGYLLLYVTNQLNNIMGA